MPSISQAKIDEYDAEIERLVRQAHNAEQRAHRAEDHIRSFDAILDKVVRAAQGRPIEDGHPDSGVYANMGGYITADGARKVKTTERQEREIRALNDRVVGLESRLAAAVAVASFARAHKA